MELCVLLMFWLSKDASTSLGIEPRRALVNSPDLRNILETELGDRSPSGRIPRMIMGRYLAWLYYFGENWVKDHIDALFPPADQALRRATWYGHFGHDQQPIVDLVSRLRSCYEE